jgi:hypothetical protein
MSSSQISLNTLAIVFSGFSKAAGELQTGFLKPLWRCKRVFYSRWRAANGFSKAAVETQTSFLKPLESCKRVF